VKKEVVAKLEVDTEQNKIQEFYAEMLKKKEEDEKAKKGEAMEVDAKPPPPQEKSGPEPETSVVSFQKYFRISELIWCNIRFLNG
jgi:hypothetical protein